MRTGQIALFPLSLVLVPGALLPLHIFEPRYRTLVDDLLTRAENPSGDLPVGFGVVAIRVGRETGVDGVRALHSVGTFGALRHVQRHEDGRFDVVVEGSNRFRPLRLDTTTSPYLQARRPVDRGSPRGRRRCSGALRRGPVRAVPPDAGAA